MNCYHVFAKLSVIDIKTVGILVSIQNQNIPLEVMTSSMQITKLLPNPNWKQEAQKRIECIRKGQIVIKYVPNLELKTDNFCDISGSITPRNIQPAS
jgi:hypothetical protein